MFKVDMANENEPGSEWKRERLRLIWRMKMSQVQYENVNEKQNDYERRRMKMSQVENVNEDEND